MKTNRKVKKFKVNFYEQNYNLALNLGNYINNNRLYIGVESMADCNEPFCDLTINIPSYMLESDNEIVVSNDFTNEIVEILEELEILTFTGKHAVSGFARYGVYRFNESKAKEYIHNDYREV